MPTILTLFKDVLRRLEPAEVDQNFENLRTNLDKLGGYAASQAPGANQIPVKNASDNLVLSSGRVLFGTAADDAANRLQVAGSMRVSGPYLAVYGATPSGYTSFFIERTDQSGVGNADRTLLDVQTGTGAARLVQLQSGVAKNDFRLLPDGNTIMGAYGNGNVLVGIGTAVTGGGCLQLKSGVSFPAAQVSSSNANTLDDYEEGTWTPVLAGDVTAGVGTYSLQEGTYTKVGRLVHVRCRLQWSAHTGTGNFLFINGLPYGCVNASALSVWASNLVIGAGKQLTAYASSGLSRVTLATIDLAGGAIGNVAIDTAGDFFLSGTYETTT